MRQKVTIWHWDDGCERFIKSVYDNASVYKTSGIANDSAGMKNNSQTKVRIFTNSNINICEGDYIFLEDDRSDTINKEKCEKITEFADRRIGKNPHWRILAI